MSISPIKFSIISRNKTKRSTAIAEVCSTSNEMFGIGKQHHILEEKGNNQLFQERKDNDNIITNLRGTSSASRHTLAIARSTKLPRASVRFFFFMGGGMLALPLQNACGYPSSTPIDITISKNRHFRASRADVTHGTSSRQRVEAFYLL